MSETFDQCVARLYAENRQLREELRSAKKSHQRAMKHLQWIKKRVRSIEVVLKPKAKRGKKR
jgi:hypothetical protein